jgi:hypothetical protein
MQKKMVLLAVLLVVGIGLIVFRSKDSHNSGDFLPPMEGGSSTSSSTSELKSPNTSEEKTILDEPSAEVKETAQVVSGNTPLEQFNQMTKCLEVDSQTFDQEDMQAETFVSRMQETFGGITMKSEDWSRRRIRTKDGQERVIKVELDENDDGRVIKKLTYFGSASESPDSVLPVANEQTENPSSTLIESLSSDGELLATEKSYTLYFNNGPQATYLERDGVVVGFHFDLNGHSFNCENMDKQGQCTCR